MPSVMDALELVEYGETHDLHITEEGDVLWDCSRARLSQGGRVHDL